MRRVALKISGPAGAGIIQAGETLSKALNRLGFFTLVYPEYPSRIRGGDNNVQVVFSSERFLSPQKKINLLLAFGKSNFADHKEELIFGGLGFESSDLEFDQMAKELGSPLVLNTVGLGFLWAVLGFNFEFLVEQIKEDFGDKKAILDLNIGAAEIGYGKAQAKGFNLNIGIKSQKKKILNLTGNEALTKGILSAQCNFAAIYPMTPINEILRLLAKSEIKVFRPEDEIAGIMSAIGASYAGKRAMVATSGGGFSLMVEGLGLSGMAEIPLVVFLGQRTGPSTGMATYTSQADLDFVIKAGHGEFPRIVLAPGDLEESYCLGMEAFNLADKYQVPVILMTDKYLAESRFSIEEENFNKIRVAIDRGKLFKGVLKNYKRYEFTADGVSPRAFPGQINFITNSYEHNEYGFSDDDTENRERMMNKRMKKLNKLTGGYKIYGKGKIALVGWGSSKETLLDFLKENKDYSLIHVWRPWPFPKELEREIKKFKKVIAVEGNFSGQLAGLIEKEAGFKIERITKDDGRPFFKEELNERIKLFRQSV